MIYFCIKNPSLKIAESDYVFIIIYSNEISLSIKFFLWRFYNSVFQLKSLFHTLQDSLQESIPKEWEWPLQIIILKSSGTWDVKWVRMFAETFIPRFAEATQIIFLPTVCFVLHIFPPWHHFRFVCSKCLLQSMYPSNFSAPNPGFCYIITKWNIIVIYLLLSLITIGCQLIINITFCYIAVSYPKYGSIL